MLEDYDQMSKGPRFIWLNWTQAINAFFKEEDDKYIFKGEIKAFTYLNKKIIISRQITKYKEVGHLVVEDRIFNKPALKLRQVWNTMYPSFLDISSFDGVQKIDPVYKQKWYSGKYGVKEPSTQINFITDCDYLKTEIKIKN